ncbi:MAG: HAMP domain-containing protein [Scytonematopsis contorta HA4267-MV1]|jgi:signal transduction histidine kinase|nr:HAMP domain-containing protein [Scytonematopsis contorta HA4267-MV1]
MKKSVTKISQNISLRLVLIIPFVLQIFAAVGLVGYFSFINGQKAVNELSVKVMNETANRVQQHLDSYLDIPHKINKININAIERGELNLEDLESARYYFWQQSQIFKDVTYIGFGLDTGQGTGVGYWLPGEGLLSEEINNGKSYSYAIDSKGNRRKQVYVTEYDFKKDGWYTDTKLAGKPIWSRIYTSESFDGYVAASANYPIYDKNRQFIGVTGVDLHLSDISSFLEKLQPSPNGKIFIIERDGLLIANSIKYPNFKKEKGEIKRLSYLNSNHPFLNTTATFLQKNFGDLKAIKGKQSISFEFNGEPHHINITPWKDEYGLDWLVIVVMPESDFMAKINANSRMTILLCFAAFIIAIILGIITSYWIQKPISNLTKASFAIASGNLEQNVKPSRLKEIKILAQSFNQMAAQLKTAFNELKITNLKLEKTNHELEKNNTELENRVAERTKELQNIIEELKQMQAQLVQAEKMSSLGQMVAGIAHEINNPVSFIYGNLSHAKEYTQDLLKLVELYQKYYPTPEVEIEKEIKNIELDFLKQDITKIHDSMGNGAERIRDIVLGLRNFSRLDEAEYKEANIHEGIDSTLMILEHRLKQQFKRPSIQVIKQYDNLPSVKCYPGQLNQVFMNVLVNAIDALDELAISQPDKKLLIRISTQFSNDKYVVISIKDNGLGIPLNIQQKIFDPFFTTKPVGKGTGMGLSISYQIITEKHGGTLECVSSPEGTSFIIRIPQ